MGIMQLFAIVWARRSIVLGCFVGTVALAVLVSLILPKSFEAEVVVLVDHDTKDVLTNEFANRTLLSDYMGKQVAIIKSNRAAYEVVEKLRLTENERFRREYLRQSKGKSSFVSFDEWVAQRLLKKLRVLPVERESSISIRYRSIDADTSATIANAFADAYMQTSVAIRAKNAQRTAVQLTEQAGTLRTELARAEKALRAFQQETGIVVADGELDGETKKLEALTKLQVQVNADTQSARAQLKAFKDAKEAGRSLDELDGIADNQLLRSLRQDIAKINGDLAQIRRRYSATHPDYTALVARKAALEREVTNEMTRLERSLESAVEAGTQKFQELNKSIAEQKERVVDLQQYWDQYVVLNNEVKTKRLQLDLTNQRAGEESIESQVSDVNALVLSAADPPTHPDFPNLFVNTALAIVFGLFFGLTMAVLVELLNRRIRSTEDLEQAAGAPVIVVLPKRASA